jgi:hypothetical protein
MQARAMSPEELLLLILGVSAVIVLFTSAMFVFFRNFLNKERDRAEAFRSNNSPPQ